MPRNPNATVSGGYEPQDAPATTSAGASGAHGSGNQPRPGTRIYEGQTTTRLDQLVTGTGVIVASKSDSAIHKRVALPGLRDLWLLGIAAATVIIVQAAVVWGMLSTARGSLAEILSTERHGLVRNTRETIRRALRRGDPAPALSQHLRRIRDAHHLHQALLVDSDGRVLADAADGQIGRMATLLALGSHRPAITETAVIRTESFVLFGETVQRVRLPLNHDGRVLSLYLDLHNPLPAALQALRAPLALGVSISAIGTMLVALVLGLGIRRQSRNRERMERINALAIAGTTAASIAHEVRNPLGSILISAQLLAQDAHLGEEERQLIDGIREDVHTASEQLEAFLNLTREMPLRDERFDLREIVDEALAALGKRPSEQNVRILRDLGNEPLPLRGDRRRLQQAVVNLVLNAIEALANEGPDTRKHIRLTGIRRGDTVRLEIEDNGPGFAPELAARVGQPFLTTKANGTGLGLAVVSRVVVRHGGELKVNSRPGRGCRMTIVMPLADTEEG